MSVVMLSGPAGIGKTAVLAEAGRDQAVRRLRRAGVSWSAIWPWASHANCSSRRSRRPGIVRGCSWAPGRPRRRSGARGRASGRSVGDPPRPARLVANLAAARPVVLEVDDVQWSDAASLRFLAFHARRLQALPVVVLLARRSGEAATDAAALRAIAELPEVHERTLNSLSASAASHVVRKLAAGADERFCAACHAASGGNPFVLRELVRSLQERGVTADAHGAARVGEVGPPNVARSVLGPLRALSRARDSKLASCCRRARRRSRAFHRPPASSARPSSPKPRQQLDTLVGGRRLSSRRAARFRARRGTPAAVREAMPPGSRSRALAPPPASAPMTARDQAASPPACSPPEPSSEPSLMKALARSGTGDLHTVSRRRSRPPARSESLDPARPPQTYARCVARPFRSGERRVTSRLKPTNDSSPQSREPRTRESGAGGSSSTYRHTAPRRPSRSPLHTSSPAEVAPRDTPTWPWSCARACSAGESRGHRRADG